MLHAAGGGGMACVKLNGILSSKWCFVVKESYVQRYSYSFYFKLK